MVPVMSKKDSKSIHDILKELSIARLGSDLRVVDSHWNGINNIDKAKKERKKDVL
jgi:hypothetical protein